MEESYFLYHRKIAKGIGIITKARNSKKKYIDYVMLYLNLPISVLL